MGAIQTRGPSPLAAAPWLAFVLVVRMVGLHLLGADVRLRR
jgi:hypothetical protein